MHSFNPRDLKATQTNVQRSLIRKLMLYELELVYNDVETAKNIGRVKEEEAVDHCTINRWFKKIRLSCKNIDGQARLA